MEWQGIKKRGAQLFDPTNGGRYTKVFNERPLKLEVIQYCVNDIELLPRLFKVYPAKICSQEDTFWRYIVRKATRDRIEDLQRIRQTCEKQSVRLLGFACSRGNRKLEQ